MKKYFCFADVHSHYKELISSLESAGFDKNNNDHIIVSCGDLLDRGNESLECLRFVNSLPKSRKILIRGNHEDLLEACIDRHEFLTCDLHNGTLKTVFNLCDKDESEFWFNDNYKVVFNLVKSCKPLYKYLNSTIDYAEIGNYIFVHGWIPSTNKHDQNWKAGDWIRARWANGMEMWRNKCNVDGKTIVCGHWHTSWGNCTLHNKGSEWGQDACFEPFVDNGIIALDGCVAYSKHVNVVVLEI